MVISVRYGGREPEREMYMSTPSQDCKDKRERHAYGNQAKIVL